MTKTSLITSFPWTRYSRKLKAKIDHPRNVGVFDPAESAARGVRLVEGVDGHIEDGNELRLYWLVDIDDGMIVDAKFQVYGQSALIGAAEVACEMVISKNYDQAQRITADLLDKQVRDKADVAAFPPETYAHLNLALGAILDCAEQCTDLPTPQGYEAPPMPFDPDKMFEGEGYPGWDELPHEQKLHIVEHVLDEEIRPYIAMDAGGIDVVKLTEDRKLHVAYQGTCTSCYSSVGATLSAIQQLVRAKVHPEIEVIPEMDQVPTEPPPWMRESL